MKTGGGYAITDDILDSGGKTGVSGSNYSLMCSFGQPAGYTDLTGAGYNIQGGYISGITAVFQIVKSTSAIVAPTGYSGGASDIVPGASVTYKLDFINLGEAAQSALIEDAVPLNMTYKFNTAVYKTNDISTSQTDTHDSDFCEFLSGTSTISCSIDNIPAGATGSLSFDVTVN